jgi:hypothetical protein
MRRHLVARIALGVIVTAVLVGALAAPASAGGRGLTRVDVYSTASHELTVVGNGAVSGKGDVNGYVGRVYGAVSFYDGETYLYSLNSGSGGNYLLAKTSQLLTYTWTVPSTATRAEVAVHFGMYSAKSNPDLNYTYQVTVGVVLTYPTTGATLLGSSSTRIAIS